MGLSIPATVELLLRQRNQLVGVAYRVTLCPSGLVSQRQGAVHQRVTIVKGGAPTLWECGKLL